MLTGIVAPAKISRKILLCELTKNVLITGLKTFATTRSAVMASRVEDGGELSNTSLHMAPLSQDKLVAQVATVQETQNYGSSYHLPGCKEPSLSETELQPWVADLLDILGCFSGDYLSHLHLKSRRVWIWTLKLKSRWRSGPGCWSQHPFACQWPLLLTWKWRPRMRWHHKPWQILVVPLFSLLGQQCGTSFKSHCLKLNVSGSGLVMTCRNTSQHGNSLHNLSAHSAPNLASLVAVDAFLAPLTTVRQTLHRPRDFPCHQPWQWSWPHFSLSWSAFRFFPAWRASQPLPVELTAADLCEVSWQGLLASASVHIAQTGRKWPKHFGIEPKKSVAAVRWLVSPNRFSSWGVLYSGRSIFDSFLVPLNSPPLSIIQFTTPAFWVCISWLCLGYHLICIMSVHNLGPLVPHI